MDDFENDTDGNRLAKNLSFDKETRVVTSHTVESVEIPTFISPTRTEFTGFPYATPYPQQIDLMRFLYDALASSKCAVIESPTGSGKSATLLTGALHWLCDHNKAVEEHINNLRNYLQKENNRLADDADWIAAHSRKRALWLQVSKELEPLEVTQRALTEASQLIKRVDVTSLSDFSKTAQSTTLDPFSSSDNNWSKSDDESFLPSDLEKNNFPVDSPVKRNRVFQIIYCSRTHSQLSQIVEEFSKLKNGLSDNITLATLASRQHLCVNEKVYSLENQKSIREACLDLKSKIPGCRFRCRRDVIQLSDYLIGSQTSAVNAASKIRNAPEGADLEDLPTRACPYYANKWGLPLAQLVLAPYQTVVVPGQREAAGLCLHDSVLIIDEAHNLLEAVAAAFSVTVAYTDLVLTERLVNAFLGYYRSRLPAVSALRLRQINLIIGGFKNLLDGKFARGNSQRQIGETPDSNRETVYKLGDFLFATGLDHINLSYVVEYLHTGQCVHKIAEFGKWFNGKQVKKQTEGEVEEKGELKRAEPELSLSACLKQLKRPSKSTEPPPEPSLYKSSRFGKDQQLPKSMEKTATPKLSASHDLQSAGASLFSVLNLLEAIVDSDLRGEDDGRLIVTSQPACTTSFSDIYPASIQFVILNPGRYLHDLVKETRSVILVGGTMKPFDEFIDQIFRPAGKLDRDIALFSCGHIINAKRQLAIYSASLSPNNIIWDFTFKNRNDARLINECGEFVIEICKVVPGGVALFFSSFDYLAVVWNSWKSSGLFARLQTVKSVFREPRTASVLAKIMQAYTTAVSKRRGACIACVIGGKLSEGINFNDDLARAVVIIGLPFPNIYSAFMQEKLRFLEQRFGDRSARQRFCETLCMRSVNQAIGRSIRHMNDYAAIFLMDQRFTTNERLLPLIPSWAQDVIQPLPQQLDALRQQLREFFQLNSNAN